ncbi:hypothetical protein AGMMS50296_5650 [Alphaproteobacteria bacterium]|nr:hypothetical protein AGMMS50296_5650 [Alphaproteobacteria bacterium]
MLPQRQELSKEDGKALLLDVTESPIERPKHKQKLYYSGKKKRQPVKTEIRVTKKGKIVHVSKTHPGSVHDFKVFKEGEPIPKDTRVFCDSGYQGLQDLHQASEFPYKKKKDKPLAPNEKEVNAALSRLRVKGENVLGIGRPSKFSQNVPETKGKGTM